jgi:hypothetical protein
VLESTERKRTKVGRLSNTKEFKDVFLDEILGLPIKRDIEFSIDLVPKFAPIFKARYIMSTPKLMTLKMELKKL